MRESEVALANTNELAYIQTGVDHSGGWIWEKLKGLRSKSDSTLDTDSDDEIDVAEDLATEELGVIRDDE